jgi:hypothetical protein
VPGNFRPRAEKSSAALSTRIGEIHELAQRSREFVLLPFDGGLEDPGEVLMVRHRSLRAFGLLLTWSLSANAQPDATRPPVGGKLATVPLITVLLPYIGDENFQKELQLTAEQVKKLLAERQKLWDERYTTPPKAYTARDAERDKATELVFKKVMTASQLARATEELATQIVWDHRVGRWGEPYFRYGEPRPTPDFRRVQLEALARHTELAAALKLDDTQKKLAELSPSRFVGWDPLYLMPDQAAIGKRLLGELSKCAWGPEYDERYGVYPSVGQLRYGPPAVQYTATRDVQKELKLTDDQLATLGELRARWRAYRADQGLSPEDQRKRVDELIAGINLVAEKTLAPTQLKRLEQIHYQQSQPVFSEWSHLGKALGVTAEQRKKYEEVSSAWRDSVAKAVLAAEKTDDVFAAISALGLEFENAGDAILTREQQEKKTELRGERFTGRIGGSGGPRGTTISELRARSFGKFGYELAALTAFNGVRDELGLTEAQEKKAMAAAREINSRFLPWEMPEDGEDPKLVVEFIAARSELVGKALADILTPEQLVRFRQIMYQRLDAKVKLDYSEQAFTAVAFPGVAEAISLTAEQKKRVIGGEKPTAVLTDDQQEALKQMLGTPVNVVELFAKRDSDKQPTLAPTAELVLNPSAWDELKVTREQSTKLARAANEYLLATRRWESTDPQLSVEKHTAAINTFTKTFESVLTLDQRKRLGQLEARILKALTPEQQAKWKELVGEQWLGFAE